MTNSEYSEHHLKYYDKLGHMVQECLHASGFIEVIIYRGLPEDAWELFQVVQMPRIM